jgi:hypothetical protein
MKLDICRIVISKLQRIEINPKYFSCRRDHINGHLKYCDYQT